MNIIALFLNNEVRTGGHRRLLELLEALATRGNDVTAILNKDLPYTPLHFDAIRLECPYKLRKFPPVSFSFKKCIKKSSHKIDCALDKADIIMIHGETHLLSALFLKKQYKVPVLYAHRSNTVRETLVALHDSGNTIRKKISLLFDILRYTYYEHTITRTCKSLIFQSPYDKDDFCTRNPRAMPKATVIRGNIGLPRFKPETEGTNTSTSLKKLLFLGTLGNRKGVRHLFAAMEILKQKGIIDLELDVIGPGDSLEYWKKWVNDHGMEDRIRILGRVSNPFGFIAKADLMVVPSDFDSYPDTVLEALHVGTPVIGSRAGGIPDMLSYPDLLFPVQNPIAIAEILQHAYTDTNFYQTFLTLCAERRKVFLFNWAEEWEKVLLRSLTNEEK